MTARSWTRALALAGSLLLSLDAAAEPGGFVGRRVDEALRDLRARGLRLVYSSELVTPDMRVRSEPRSTSAREQLTEILAPHGLVAESGPGGVIQVVRRRQRVMPGQDRGIDAARSGRASAIRSSGTAAEAVHLERLTVTGRTGAFADLDGAGRVLHPDELGSLAGRIADDPMRVVQALPGVAASDDFRSDFSVRGSPYRHAAVVVDDVVAPWLQHAAAGRRDTGTLAMLPGDAVEDALLLVGAYPRIDAGQIGPQLRLTVREGSREARLVRASVSASSAAVSAEGPLGRAQRGSWMAAVRRSHVEWPVGRSDHDMTVFGFTDLQSKLVYDVRPDQQVSLSVVGGVSLIERDDLDPVSFRDGRNRAGMVSLGWRSQMASTTVVTQRLSVVAHDFTNGDHAGRTVGSGRDAAASYRVDLFHAVAGGLVEAGGQVRRVRGGRQGQWWSSAWPFPRAQDAAVGASWLDRSGYASFTTPPRARATLSAGVRLADSTLVDGAALDRWVQTTWAAGRRWSLRAAVATVHQFPMLDQVDPAGDGVPLRAERATVAEVGLSRPMSTSLAWDATIFVRRERDALREPLAFVPVDRTLDDQPGFSRFANLLSGSARGVELAVTRRAPTGVTGSIGYAYGVARYADAQRGEAFDADFDQRHAVNATGSMPLPWASRIGVTFRAGSNFPIPGYLVRRDGRLFASDRRNQVRLPAYARLDVRLERAVQRGERRVVFFLEALNLLNRTNLGPAEGRVLEGTGEVVGVTERLFPRMVGGGIRVALGPATAR